MLPLAYRSQADGPAASRVEVDEPGRPVKIAGRIDEEQVRVGVEDGLDEVIASRKLVEAMTTRGPFERFVWSVAFDRDRLDYHPDSPEKTFDPDEIVVKVKASAMALRSLSPRVMPP